MSDNNRNLHLPNLLRHPRQCTSFPHLRLWQRDLPSQSRRAPSWHVLSSSHRFSRRNSHCMSWWRRHGRIRQHRGPTRMGYTDALHDCHQWSIATELQLPISCNRMHFTNRHKKGNIAIEHKTVMRVERGDNTFVDLKTGKRKQFDIVVQTPLHILSVRVFCHFMFIHICWPFFSVVSLLSRMDILASLLVLRNRQPRQGS